MRKNTHTQQQLTHITIVEPQTLLSLFKKKKYFN